MVGKTSPVNAWTAYVQLNPKARLRLFCLPYAGGGASIYRTWAKELPGSVEVVPVQLPGREARLREAPLTRIGPLVEAAGSSLSPYFDTPFCFFGHSMGSIVSFELARHLRRKYGLAPTHLFVSGRRAPHIPDPDPPKYNLPDKEFLAEIGRLNGTPDAALQSEELMQLLLPTLRADCEVIDEYRFAEEPPLSCSITVYGGLDDPETRQEELGAWRRHTGGGFCVQMFPGDHFFLQASRQPLLEALSAELASLAAVV